MWDKKIILVSIAILTALTAIHYTSPLSLGDQNPSIGVALPLDSNTGWIAEPVEDVSTLVEKEVEAAGGVHGEEMELIIEDTKGEEAETVDAVQKLIHLDRVDAVFGPMMTKGASSAIPLARNNNVPMVSPSVTGTEVMEVPDNDYFYRTVSGEDIAADALADLAEQRGVEDSVALVVNDAYGQTYFERLQDNLDGEIEPIYFSDDATTLRSELEQMDRKDPDTVFLLGYSEVGTRLLTEAFEMGVYDEHEWLVNDPILNIDFVEELGVDDDGEYIMEGLTGVRPEENQTGPGFQNFDNQYQSYMGEEPPTTPFIEESYDAYAVLILGMEKSESLEGEEIRGNLREVAESPGREVSTIEDGLNAIQSGEDVHYLGASSDVVFDGNGTDISTNYMKAIYTEGEIVEEELE